MINAFEIYRNLRHSVAYDLDTQISKKDAENIIEFAKDSLCSAEKSAAESAIVVDKGITMACSVKAMVSNAC